MKISLILGSIREGRQSEKVAVAIKSLLEERDIEVDYIDLKELNLPLFDGTYEGESVKRLQKSFAECTGVIIVTPEYNHSISSALKNCIDFMENKELYNKPMAGIGVSAGGYGGVRALEHLHGVWLGVGGISLPKYLPTPNVYDFDAENPPSNWLKAAEGFLDTNLELIKKIG